MDILWAGLAVCALVAVVFYALAKSWQRVLRKQSRAIGALFQRIEALEGMEDPLMQRRIRELAPSPLQQVHVFSFRLGERFWRKMLKVSSAQMQYLHEHATFIGSMKLEMWQSHTVITLHEIRPQNQSASWQTRSIGIYPSDSPKQHVLWELTLGAQSKWQHETESALELRYERGAIVLGIRNEPRQPAAAPRNSEIGERIVFRLPLDAEQLANFRVSNEEIEEFTAQSEGTDGHAEVHETLTRSELFSFEDEGQDVSWRLCIRDLHRSSTARTWVTVEPLQTRRVS